jgi:hypothetical protein
MPASKHLVKEVYGIVLGGKVAEGFIKRAFRREFEFDLKLANK